MSRVLRIATLVLLVGLAPRGALAAEVSAPTDWFNSVLQSLASLLTPVAPGLETEPTASSDTVAPVSTSSGPISSAEGGDEGEAGPIYIPWG